ncbi:hypothetical protein BU16DRAFT_558103 [Lophium mytilinum]|uniref:YTH domain-containing protein n=1 Tax=Lophium mytilinum TaxID=390894 RepID=A0A6A6R4W6_9PEZI|nr:hypothetical protein BU16DRAFT_558103 [Lophium mytilinum]
MAFVWVQQWIALPVVLEEQMGDLTSDPAGFQSFESSRAGFSQDEPKTTAISAAHPGSTDFGNPNANAPFYSRFSSLPAPQPRPDNARAHVQHGNTSYSSAPGHDIGPATFNMGSIAGALPDYSSAQNHPQMPQGPRGPAGVSPSALAYQVQQLAQFPNQSSGMYQGQTPFAHGYAQNQYSNYIPSQSAHHGAYQSFNPNSTRSAGQNPLNAPYANYMQPSSQYLYYPSPYGLQGSYPQQYPAQVPQQSAYNRRSSLPSAQMPMMAQNMNPAALSGSYPTTSRSDTGGMPGDYTGGAGVQGANRQSAEPTANSIPRGPPRKPKQSGHALWVGNLPPGTTVIDLKDHFSKDATKDIESLFLISKSNCAFVNYRTEASCADAMHRFHDSRFQGVRLVCRLRRSSAATSGVPTGPSAMTGPRPPSISPERTPPLVDGELETEEAKVEATPEEAENTTRVAEKFFIVKSLTLQDLELSVRNGIWATQSHNEETLNKAYESADNVYLIFSANKSGEYFGYARMTSSIHEDASQIINTVARAEISETADVPKSIPTPATEHAPKGRIIDDSARGTIFWEAVTSDNEGEESNAPEVESTPAGTDFLATAQTWGKPFKVEWISTSRLPFYRTRGLRNPWNANREVKIARDGTELETSVGKRLVQMFHRLGQTNTGPSNISAMQMPPTMRPF